MLYASCVWLQDHKTMCKKKKSSVRSPQAIGITCLMNVSLYSMFNLNNLTQLTAWGHSIDFNHCRSFKLFSIQVVRCSKNATACIKSVTHKPTIDRTSVSFSFTSYFFLYLVVTVRTVPGTGVVGAALCFKLLDNGFPEGLILLICPLWHQEIISQTHSSLTLHLWGFHHFHWPIPHSSLISKAVLQKKKNLVINVNYIMSWATLHTKLQCKCGDG